MLEIKNNYFGESGVFTKEDIKQGQVIHNLSGEISSERTRESIEIYLSVQGQKKEMHITDSFFEYCNHNNTPNVKINKYTHDVTALEDLPKGTEVVFNYTQHESAISTPFTDKKSGDKIQ